MAQQPFVGPWPLFQFHNPIHNRLGNKPVASPVPTLRTIQRVNKRKQTYTPRVGFEPTIPAFKRAKTVHALDCAATVIVKDNVLLSRFCLWTLRERYFWFCLRFSQQWICRLLLSFVWRRVVQKLFGEMYCRHIQGRSISQKSHEQI
jgi:hypothetical protein